MDANLIQLLQDCKHKLELYRAQHSGEYVGGVEFTELIRRIDAATFAERMKTGHPLTQMAQTKKSDLKA
jgi:hypothetical protein